VFNQFTTIEVNWEDNFEEMIKTKGKSYHTYIKDCAIDALYLKNFSPERFRIINCYINDTLDKSISIFNVLLKRKSDDLYGFVRFCRLMKKLFTNSDFIEIYDHFYILDQYYSRFLPTCGKINRIVNYFSYRFSLYGYSIWRSIKWLISVLLIFNFIYFFFDYCDHYIKSDTNIFYGFLQTFGNHLEQITFFKSPNKWFDQGTIKRFVLIVELILLIPIVTSIILGIRKIFKRA